MTTLVVFLMAPFILLVAGGLGRTAAFVLREDPVFLGWLSAYLISGALFVAGCWVLLP